MTPETRTARARDLRKRQTYAEAVLWQHLRASRLEGLKFRRQHGIGPYFADFACEALRIVIELDGGIHDDDDQQLNDYHRQQAIEALGWCVLRFPNEHVTGSIRTVLDAIRAQTKLASALTPLPPVDDVDGPLPLPPGQGIRKRFIPKARQPRYRP